MTTEESALHDTLNAYARALRASRTDEVLALYAPDGVFMPQNSPSSVGLESVRRAYEAVFAAITLDVTFEIIEARQVAPDWAFARTSSSGRVTVHATSESSAESNQELFVLQKLDGAWKIARYCFSTTKAVHA
jgi:uncharacterized protein (TIGR02246 family)